jgi:carboxypeptidase C (cathepsin A)
MGNSERFPNRCTLNAEAASSDWICNWKSNEAWLNRLIWSGSKDYLSQEMQPWHVKVDGEKKHAGDTKTSVSLGGGKISESVLVRFDLQSLTRLL